MDSVVQGQFWECLAGFSPFLPSKKKSSPYNFISFITIITTLDTMGLTLTWFEHRLALDTMFTLAQRACDNKASDDSPMRNKNLPINLRGRR